MLYVCVVCVYIIVAILHKFLRLFAITEYYTKLFLCTALIWEYLDSLVSCVWDMGRKIERENERKRSREHYDEYIKCAILQISFICCFCIGTNIFVLYRWVLPAPFSFSLTPALCILAKHEIASHDCRALHELCICARFSLCKFLWILHKSQTTIRQVLSSSSSSLLPAEEVLQARSHTTTNNERRVKNTKQ